MYAHDLRGQETRRLRRGLHEGRERALTGLAQGPGTARAPSAGQPDLRELLCPPQE
jgi:hypothetical protein